MRQPRDVPTREIIPTIHKRSHIATLGYYRNCFVLTSFLCRLFKVPSFISRRCGKRSRFSRFGYWSPQEEIFFGCIQLALAWCPPPLKKKAVLGGEEGEGKKKGKKGRKREKSGGYDAPLFCLFSPGREAEVCNSIRGKVAKGGIIPTKRDREREYDEPAKLATSTRCPQRLFR